MLTNYGKPCLTGDHILLEWYPGQIDVVHKGTEEVWLAMGGIMLAYGYRPRDADTGFYSCRNVTGGSTPSKHSWPTAGDVNWRTNPYIKTPTLRKIRWGVDTDMPAAMVNEILQIKAGGEQALIWGGNWRTIKDAMHYEIRVSLGRIAQGITSPRASYRGAIDMTLKKGDKGAAVTLFQKALIAWEPQALPQFGADGDYGNETAAWVANYQKAAELNQTGEIDGVTAALLQRYTASPTASVPKHGHDVAVKAGSKPTVTIGDPT